MDSLKTKSDDLYWSSIESKSTTLFVTSVSVATLIYTIVCLIRKRRKESTNSNSQSTDQVYLETDQVFHFLALIGVSITFAGIYLQENGVIATVLLGSCLIAMLHHAKNTRQKITRGSPKGEKEQQNENSACGSKDGRTESQYCLLPEGYTTTDPHELAAIKEFEEVQALPWLSWYFMSVNLPMSAYIFVVHILSLWGLFYLGTCKPETYLWCFALWYVSEYGITAGSHRLWSHKSYKANLPYRFIVMIFASVANQGTIYHWARDHRVHHRYSETRADPHNALRGFFFAHVGWLLVKKDPRVIFAGRKLDLTDIADLPEVKLQKRLDPFWNFFWCFAVPTLVPWLLWGESLLVGFLVAGVLRYCIVLHCTWLVNSAAHFYGDKPYSDINPSENPLVTLLASGEGWHNFHHTFPFDYSASELGIMNQWNPTRAVIDACARFGWVWDRRRADEHWKARCKRKGIEEDAFTSVPLFRVRCSNATKANEN